MNDLPTPSPTAGIGRFSVRVLLFLIPFALLGVYLLRAPLPRTYAWDFVRGDCHKRGVWIRDRLAAVNIPMDVAFVGTSRTIRSMDDAEIEKELRKRGSDLKVANLGYCRNGRNLQVAIAREFMTAKPGGHLVIEVSNREFPTTHPLFGYVAQTDDLWSRLPERGLDVPRDLYHGMLTRLDEVKTRLLGLPYPEVEEPESVHLVWGSYKRERQAMMRGTKIRRTKRAERRGGPSASRSRLGHAEIRHLAGLAAATDTKLHFLYLQSYAEPWARIWSKDLYEQFGDVWIPPREIFESPWNWADVHHLNKFASDRLAVWAAEKIIEAR